MTTSRRWLPRPSSVKQDYAFSERRACRLMMLAVTTYGYRSQRSVDKRGPKSDEAYVRDVLEEMASARISRCARRQRLIDDPSLLSDTSLLPLRTGRSLFVFGNSCYLLSAYFSMVFGYSRIDCQTQPGDQ